MANCRENKAFMIACVPVACFLDMHGAESDFLNFL